MQSFTSIAVRRGPVGSTQSVTVTPWKKLIVHAWTDQHRHFGHHATSRVEGSHKTIKGNLQVSTGDLKTVYNKITMMLLGQHSEHDAAIDSDRS